MKGKTKKYSRNEYLEGLVDFHDYYLQFSSAVESIVNCRFPLKELRNAYKEDINLNNIYLRAWDAISISCQGSIARINEELGNGRVWCLSDGVCAAKAYAVHKILTEG